MLLNLGGRGEGDERFSSPVVVVELLGIKAGVFLLVRGDLTFARSCPGTYVDVYLATLINIARNFSVDRGFFVWGSERLQKIAR